VLAWEGCRNVRDLGGHPTRNGRETRFGAVVRADSVRRLTEAGWSALVGYGVARVVDLRFETDLAADPPLEPPVEVVHVAVFDPLDSPQWAEIDAIWEAAPDDVTATEPRSVVSRRLLAEIAWHEGGNVEKAASGDPPGEIQKLIAEPRLVRQRRRGTRAVWHSSRPAQ